MVTVALSKVLILMTSSILADLWVVALERAVQCFSRRGLAPWSRAFRYGGVLQVFSVRPFLNGARLITIDTDVVMTPTPWPC